jgi:hypothetical protein
VAPTREDRDLVSLYPMIIANKAKNKDYFKKKKKKKKRER